MTQVPQSVRDLFARYERVTNAALSGDVDLDALSDLYTPEFISATPAGVMTGKNDAALGAAMVRGFDYQRALGTKKMVVRSVSASPLDERHCVAHVAWTASYAKAGLPDIIAIDFDVHYLVRLDDSTARVFGWVAGDEQAALKEHGVI